MRSRSTLLVAVLGLAGCSLLIDAGGNDFSDDAGADAAENDASGIVFNGCLDPLSPATSSNSFRFCPSGSAANVLHLDSVEGNMAVDFGNPVVLQRNAIAFSGGEMGRGPDSRGVLLPCVTGDALTIEAIVVSDAAQPNASRHTLVALEDAGGAETTISIGNDGTVILGSGPDESGTSLVVTPGVVSYLAVTISGTSADVVLLQAGDDSGSTEPATVVAPSAMDMTSPWLFSVGNAPSETEPWAGDMYFAAVECVAYSALQLASRATNKLGELE